MHLLGHVYDDAFYVKCAGISLYLNDLTSGVDVSTACM